MDNLIQKKDLMIISKIYFVYTLDIIELYILHCFTKVRISIYFIIVEPESFNLTETVSSQRNSLHQNNVYRLDSPLKMITGFHALNQSRAGTVQEHIKERI